MAIPSSPAADIPQQAVIMALPDQSDSARGNPAAARASDLVLPLSFSAHVDHDGVASYLLQSPFKELLAFFQGKGLSAIKEEDRRQQWYEDWLEYQARHRLYAMVLSPRQYSTIGAKWDLLRLTRFLEAFAYFSPAHGYSLQCTFLGLFAILMGTNEALKKEAVAALEAGRLLGFGVSEKHHGSDILANEFTITPASDGGYIANGSKYYIGNANCAAMISVLARRADQRRSARAPFCLVALRPDKIQSWRPRKIDTLGVRAAFVGEFEVKEQLIAQTDLIAEGRDAWNAVLGTVSLGKFFLGFGSIGICEHAYEEAMQHMSTRVLYGKPVIQMPHIRFMAAQAFARLAAMKMYAYRALDYVHAATAEDRRYLLYCAVQKAKVSTEGVKVMSLLLECVGAKGLESDTYFEMAMRDVQLIPGLESSMHINLALAAQFGSAYFSRTPADVSVPGSLVTEEIRSVENDYLMRADIGHTNTVAFGHFLKAYRPHKAIRNVRKFVRQAKAFAKWIRRSMQLKTADTQIALATGQCLATIAYGELIAQSAGRLKMPAEIVSAIFHFLIGDLSAAAMAMISLPGMASSDRALLRRMIALPRASDADWDFVVTRMGRAAPEAGTMTIERTLSWKWLQILARVLATRLFEFKVYGRKNIPALGGVLIVSNDQSYLDPILMAVRLDRPLNYIAKSELFENPYFGRFLRHVLNAFPVRQGAGDIGAIRETIRRLEEGHLLNMYPEGSRTEDRHIAALQKGVALVIRRAKVPVVPAVIVGAFEAWPIWRPMLRVRPIHIRFGLPMNLANLDEDQIVAAIDQTLRLMFRAECAQRQAGNYAAACGNGRPISASQR